jgi:hypothetical protein
MAGLCMPRLEPPTLRPQGALDCACCFGLHGTSRSARVMPFPIPSLAPCLAIAPSSCMPSRFEPCKHAGVVVYPRAIKALGVPAVRSPFTFRRWPVLSSIRSKRVVVHFTGSKPWAQTVRWTRRIRQSANGKQYMWCDLTTCHALHCKRAVVFLARFCVSQLRS